MARFSKRFYQYDRRSSFRHRTDPFVGLSEAHQIGSGPEYWAHSGDYFPKELLSKEFTGFGNFRLLKILALCEMALSEDALSCLLARCPSTLTELTLSSITLLSGSWKAIFVTIAERFDLRILQMNDLYEQTKPISFYAINRERPDIGAYLYSPCGEFRSWREADLQGSEAEKQQEWDECYVVVEHCPIPAMIYLDYDAGDVVSDWLPIIIEKHLVCEANQ